MVDTQVAAELRQAYDAWFDALARGDVEYIRGQIDDRWSYTDSTGVVRGKEEYLGLIAAAPPIALRIAEFDVLALGGVATIRATWMTSATVPGSAVELSSTTSHTGIWFRADEGWRSLIHHVTTVTDSALRRPR